MRISDQLLMDCGYQRLLTHIFLAMHWHCVWQRTNSGNHTDPYEFTEVLQSSTRLRLVATLAGKCCQTHRAIRHVSSFIFPAKWEKIDRLHWLHFFQFKTQRHVTCCAWLASHSRPLQRPLPVPECPTLPKWYWLWNRSEPLNPLLSSDMMHFRHKTTVLHSRSNAIAEKRNVLWDVKVCQSAVDGLQSGKQHVIQIHGQQPQEALCAGSVHSVAGVILIRARLSKISQVIENTRVELFRMKIDVPSPINNHTHMWSKHLLLSKHSYPVPNIDLPRRPRHLDKNTWEILRVSKPKISATSSGWMNLFKKFTTSPAAQHTAVGLWKGIAHSPRKSNAPGCVDIQNHQRLPEQRLDRTP